MWPPLSLVEAMGPTELLRKGRGDCPTCLINSSHVSSSLSALTQFQFRLLVVPKQCLLNLLCFWSRCSEYAIVAYSSPFYAYQDFHIFRHSINIISNMGHPLKSLFNSGDSFLWGCHTWYLHCRHLLLCVHLCFSAFFSPYVNMSHSSL